MYLIPTVVIAAGLSVVLARSWRARGFALIAKTMEDGVVIHRNGRAMVMNDSVLRMTGYSRREFRNRDLVATLVHPQSREAVLDSMRRASEAPYRITALRKDGSTFPAELRPRTMGRRRIVVVRDLTKIREAERAREASEARYRNLFDSMADAIVIHRGGLTSDVNATFLTIFGYKRHEVIGRNAVDMIVAEADRPEVFRHIVERATESYECRAVARDGRVIDIEVAPREIIHEGVPLRFAVLRDITPRKLAEAKLARQLSLYRATLEATHEGVLVVNLRNGVESFNGRFLEMWDVPKDFQEGGDDAALLRFSMSKVLRPQSFLRRVQELYDDPMRESDDVVELKDGRVLERHSRPQLLDGAPVGRVWSFRDVTEREQSRAELRRQVAQLEATFQATSEGILFLDTNGGIAACNRRLIAMWGLPEDFPAGEAPAPGIGRVEDPELCSGRSPTQPVNGGLVTVLRLTDGRVFERVDHPHRVDGAEVGRVIGYRDLTARIREEDRLRHFNAELEGRVRERTLELERANLTLRASNTELEAFSFSVSHDLRAPLRGIDGLSAALAEEYSDAFDETARDYLSRIRSGVRRMGRIMDDLIHLSRVNRATVKPELVDLSAIATGIVDTLRRENPDRTVVFDGRPGAIACGDRRLLRVVLENLIGNAWKYSSKKPAAVILFGFEDKADGSREFFVRDNGAGFDPAYKDKLFKTFARLHGPQEFEGTGLGLAIVGRIVARHGGAIVADATPDHGAVFTFTLPGAPAASQAPA